MRDYDKEPIVVMDYGACFLWGWNFIVIIFCFAYLAYTVVTTRSLGDFSVFGTICIIASMYFFIDCIIKTPSKFRWQPSYFKFYNNEIYHIEHVYADKIFKEEKTAPNIKENLEKVYFCVVSELDSRFGRFHYLSAYRLYKKSSIGVHIGKTALFLRYTLIFFIFVLPYKFYRLCKTKEPLWLLNKNFVIRFKNRNYFLVNVYSVGEYDELLRYFKRLGTKVERKTEFIPQCQNMGYFIDKNEIWNDDFSDIAIPKEGFEKWFRRFFSLE